jgi:DNA-binding NtrC family response regulator
VLQTRTFERMGDTKALHFRGKIIAATNRDLGREIAAGRFREDFYYRLCADIIHTPALAEQLVAEGEELPNLVLFIARRLVGDDEAPPLAEETLAWIDRSLGRKYGWPGNVRELEQCVRNVLIRGEYRPQRAAGNGSEDLAAAISAGTLTADDLLGRYCTLVFAETRSYQETARRLGIDRRTVRRRVDPELLRALDSGDGERRPADRRLQERIE